MKKKFKLALNELEVQSFVTTLEHEHLLYAKGGAESIVCVPTNNQGVCHTKLQSCISGCVSCPECIPPYKD